MATTFNGLVLDELGTIGNPQVEYANFIATTASPAGYDGAVLKNFKRDYTTIKFDLTLAGTESECLNKLNTLVGALNAGQGELVMPGQAERGTHFNAVPNMKIAHSLRGFDGMTVPCTFIVPEGCAVSVPRTATIQNNIRERIFIDGCMSTFFYASFTIANETTLTANWAHLAFINVYTRPTKYASIGIYQHPGTAAPKIPARTTFAMSSELLQVTSDTELVNMDVSYAFNSARYPRQLTQLPPGEVDIICWVNSNVTSEQPLWTLSWVERSVW